MSMGEGPLPELAADFHVRLRKARRHARLTQSAVAAACGVSRNAVTHWEHPEGTRPTLAHLSCVAHATGVAFEWLCTGRGRMVYQALDDREEAGVLLRYCAQDETEERILVDLRRLSYAQTLAIATLVSTLAREAAAAEDGPRRPAQRRPGGRDAGEAAD
jgi:transcriptional regulator with XRE-family HTH domain